MLRDGPPQGILVLGIDPGTAATGYGLIAVDGNRLHHVTHGAWRPSSRLSAAEKLRFLATELEGFIRERSPAALGIEQAFVGKNVQSALRLGEARGALMLVASQRGLQPAEFPTATVKKAITGNGRASKEQVQFMVSKLLSLREAPRPEDAADALAVAITQALEMRFSARGAGSQGRR